MKLIPLLMALLLWPLPLLAETYTWVDEHGTVNFTDDYSSIPKKFRKKVKRMDSTDGQAEPTARESDTDAGKTGNPGQPRTRDGSAAPAEADNRLYGGKKAETWQQEFRSRGAELKRLERQLIELEALIKKPVGISPERVFGLPQEFRDTQKQYNDALKRYNELNDAANQAGLPAEYRK